MQLVRLGGMSELELNELITSLAPARPSRGLLSEVTEVTGGNPLLVRTMVARQLDAGGLVVRDGELVSTVDELVPGGLDSELRRRLDVVGRPCRGMLTRPPSSATARSSPTSSRSSAADFDDLLAEAEACRSRCVTTASGTRSTTRSCASCCTTSPAGATASAST